MNQAKYGDIPPWLRYFLIHVVKRCCGILIAWICDMEEALKQ
jgi:hypothetical protein